MYYLEQACRHAGRRHVGRSEGCWCRRTQWPTTPPSSFASFESKGQRPWAALKRRLDREAPITRLDAGIARPCNPRAGQEQQLGDAHGLIGARATKRSDEHFGVAIFWQQGGSSKMYQPKVTVETAAEVKEIPRQGLPKPGCQDYRPH